MTPVTGKHSAAEISQTQAIATAVAEAVGEQLLARDETNRESSQSQLRIFKRLIAAKDIAIAVAFFGTLIAGTVVTFQELRAKPSKQDVTEAIEKRVTTVEQSVNEQSTRIERIESKVDTLDQSVDTVLTEVQHQGRVLDCMNDKACKKTPQRPSRLETP